MDDDCEFDGGWTASFQSVSYQSGESDDIDIFDALDVYRSTSADPVAADDDQLVTTLLFTASNPDRTVSAVALMNGRILRVDLARDVVDMGESELSSEIASVAELARLQARAAQHIVIAELMGRRGQDSAAIQSFLWRELGLPTTEMVTTRRAELFA